MHDSVTEQVTAVVRSARFTNVVRRGGGIQPSDLIRQLGIPLVLTQCAKTDPQITNATTALPADSAETVRAAVEVVAPQLLAGAELAAAVVRDVVECTPALRPATVGEKVLIRIRSYLALHEDLPDTQWTDHVVTELAVAETSPVSITGFATLYADPWRLAWRDQGVAALASYPPSTIGLGMDAAPPLLPHGSGRSWFAGTDRCVYDRYTLAWRGRSHQPEPRVATANHQPSSPRSTPDPHQRAAEEIDRASSGYGLSTTHHRAVLQALSAGATTALPNLPGHAWRTYRAACLTGSSALLQFSEAVADYLNAWVRDAGTTEEIVLRHGHLDNHSDKIAAAIVRKVWMDLHRREREFDQPACSCLMARYTRTAIEKAIVEALNRWEGPSIDPPEPHTGRDNATFQLLLQHPTVATAAFAQAPGWETAYRDLVRPDPTTFMTVDQLRTYILGSQGRQA